MLARALLLGLLALASFSSRAWATGPATYPPGGSGSGVVANACSAGDFFSAVDGSGNFTCATPAGSGDVTAVGDCASGACFTGTTGSTLTGATGTSLVANSDNNIYLSFDTDNNSTATGVVIGSNASGSSATPWVVVSDAAGKNMTLRNATTLRINDPSDDTNYVEFTAPTIGSNVALTLPTSGGTVPSSATAPVTLSAAGVLALTQNAGTDVTADLEEETHATEHSLGGTDPITVTNLASACTNGQVLGGTLAGTGVECQADVDTDTNASTLCAGTTTYLDGEGNCDDISAVYAPVGATYITQTANGALTNEQAMGSLGTGLVMNTTTTGVQSIYTGASCTNQFPRALSASGAPTCASIAAADMAASSVVGGSAGTIQDNTVTADDLAADSVTGSELADSAIDDIVGQLDAGTGVAADISTSPDTLNVAMGEVGLAQSSIWQGNSSGFAAVYSNPSGIDIRTYGAACDGSQDDSQEIQDAIDDLNTAGGGTILIPNTGLPCMVSTETTNDYIQLKSNVSIVCAPGAEIKASSATPPLALFKATGTGASSVDNWRFSGCYLNLDQQQISAVYVEEGSNYSFDHNSVEFNGDGDAAGATTTTFDIVHLDCKNTEYAPSSSPPYEGAPCSITHNSVRGSERDAQNDTCYSVFGAGGLLGLGHGALFANNFAQHCGGSCLKADGGATTISANNLADCLDYGIASLSASSPLSSSAITGNVVQATGSEASFYGVSVQNLQIVGNAFPILGTGRAIQLRTAAGATISGINIANNYAANTIHLDAVGSCVGGANVGLDCDADADCPASTCGTYGQFNHNIIFNNIIATPPTATWSGIDVENAQGWITVIDNTDVGTSASTRSSIKFTSLDSVKKGGILVSNNNLAPAGAGTGTCITFDHTAGGALEAVNVVGNLCGGVDSAGTTIASIDKGLEIIGSPTRTNFNMDGNNFGNTTTAYTGITDRNVVQQTTAPACVAAGTAANDTWHIEDFSYTNAVAGKPVFVTATVSFTDANTTIEDIEWFLYDNGSSACPTDCVTTAPSGTALAPTGGIVTKSSAVAGQYQNATFTWVDTVPIAGTNIYCLGLENATNGTGDPTVGNVTFTAWQ